MSQSPGLEIEDRHKGQDWCVCIIIPELVGDVVGEVTTHHVQLFLQATPLKLYLCVGLQPWGVNIHEQRSWQLVAHYEEWCEQNLCGIAIKEFITM